MSVLQCDRSNCDNIMCSTLINNCYICDECKDEFENLYTNAFNQLTEKEWMKLFMEFMDSEKYPGSNSLMTINDFLNGRKL